MPSEATLRQNMLRSVWNKFLDLMLGEEIQDYTSPAEPVERAIGFERVRAKLQTVLRSEEMYDEYGWCWPIDIYMDDDKSLFAVVAREGSLFRVPMTFAEDELTLGAWEQVVEQFVPAATTAKTNNRTLTVIRQADGRVRWVARACTAVLNRVGEIDSTKLFDSFVEADVAGEKKPELWYYHAGEKFRMGVADFVGRDGLVYINSGLFDQNNLLADAAIKALERDKSGYWGVSIGYIPTSEPEKLRITDEVSIPVYTSGLHRELSMLPEDVAASLFTSLALHEGIERAMDKLMLEKLQELFGEDKDGLAQFVASVDDVNRQAKDGNLIHREKVETTTPETAPAAEQKMEFELDDVAIQRIAEMVGTGVGAKVTGLEENFARMSGELEKVVGAVNTLTAGMTKLLADEEEKKRTWLSDLPAKPKITANYRASNGNGNQVEVPPTFDVQAGSVLDKIPTYGQVAKTK